MESYKEVSINHFFKENIVHFQNGFPCGNWNEIGKGVVQLRPFNVKNDGSLTFHQLKYIETDKNIEKYIVKLNDVLFNNTNSEDLVGKTTLWSNNMRVVLSNHMTIIRVLNKDKLDPQFLSFFLHKKWYDGFYKSVCRRHVNQASVSIERLRNICIPEFTISEQRKIAYVLSTIQAAIEKQEQIIQTTTELKKALMHKLFTEGLHSEPQKQTEIGLVPESWEVVEIGELFKFTSGKTRPQNTSKIKTDELQIPVYGGNGILGYSDQIFLNEKTLILGRVGEYCGCAHLTESRCWISDNALYAKETKERLNLDFIKDCFEFLDLNKFSNKMGQPLITQGIINQVKFALPPLDQQNEISQILKAADNKIVNGAHNKGVLEELFKSMLQQLMTGQIRVHEIEFENSACGEE